MLRISIRNERKTARQGQRLTLHISIPKGHWNQSSTISGYQLEVIRLIRDGLVAEGAHDGPVAQVEDAGHLVPIFLDHADAVLAHRALEPAGPHRGNQKMGENVLARQSEDRPGIERGFRITDPLNAGEMVVVKIRSGPLR